MGVTPVDAAGGLIGLANLAAVNRFFWDHHLYLAAFAASLILVGVRVAAGRLHGRDLVWTLALNSLLIGAFASGGRSATASVATTGEQVVTVEQLAGFTSVRGVPATFHMIDEAETALTVGLIQLFTKIPGGTDFLAAPFHVQTLANSLALAHIQDPKTRGSFFDFLGECYTPALAQWARAEGGEAMKERLLPSKLSAYYQKIPHPSGTGTCLEAWTRVREDVYQDGVAQQTVGRLDQFAHLIGAAIPQVRDWLMDAMVQHYSARFGSLEAFGVSILDNQNPSLLGNPLGWVARRGISWLANYPMAAGLSEALKGAGPQVASYTLAVLKGLFPFVLAFAILTAFYGELVRFFTYLLSVKMWFVGWAMVDAASTMSKKIFYPADSFAGGYSYSYYDMFATALMYVTVPALMTYVIAGAGHNAAAALNRLGGSLPIGTVLGFGRGPQ